MQIADKYAPQQIESKWYDYWIEQHIFHSEPDQREPYTIVIPPPNVTGMLHMGHMLNNTLQDVLVRRARMSGKNACWVPGMDHASIATEAKVVAMLREKDIEKSSLTREEFLRHAWEWKEKYGGVILKQLRKLGASCDWDRTCFTMDEARTESVLRVFCDLYEKGKIYRGVRMVNWDPAAQTALSDEEVVFKDIAGKVVVSDIAKMPHMLIAGSTGSGKSVCINTLIMSILYKAKPSEVKLILVDPKVVELSVYNGIPHLLIPVVTDPKKASAALQWGVAEMTDRYQKFADSNVRDLKGYNKKLEERRQKGEEGIPNDLPQIVIIVDELADLMMVAPGEVEEAICRLAQLARAAGIHLIIATQRPSVDVITGLIKANMPSRVAFAVSSGVDSRTILDMNGAEKLLGKGDMLFYPQGYSKPVRVQGAFVSDNEVSDVVDFLKNQNIGNVYDASNEIEEKMKSIGTSSGSATSGSSGPEYDAYFADAGRFIIEKDKASIGMLQRVFKIGFNRAARLMDQLAEVGVVGEEEGTKPRKVLMTETEFEQLVEEIL